MLVQLHFQHFYSISSSIQI